MKILAVGATGATGRHLVEQLLQSGQTVKAVVRSPDRLPEALRIQDNLSIVHASVLNLSDAEMAQLVHGCGGVASCLGHNPTLKGIYGQPRRLVADATRRLCAAIKMNTPEEPTRFVLMNTVGNSNRDLDEPIAFGEKCVITLLRLMLPPQIDNERAADYLRTEIGPNDGAIEWAVVRPSSLCDEDEVTEFEVHASPTTGVIFGAGQTSRINVGRFMADLITDDDTWRKWKGTMPVIYNKDST